MLAKMWKKFLLAICIIACIYNIMSKLVNRASLEANLRRANDGNTVFDFSSKETKKTSSEIVNSASKENINIENSGNSIVEEEIETEDQTPVEDEPEEKDNGSSIVNFKDFIFKW